MTARLSEILIGLILNSTNMVISPNKYIFYKWGYFILAFGIIIGEIIRQIKKIQID